MQVFETLGLGVHNEGLVLNGHELGVEPGAEKLSVEGLEPFVVVVFVGHLEGNCSGVRLDLSRVKEHLVDFLVGVSVGTTQIVGLTNSLLHLKAVHDSKSNIRDEDWLNLGVHTFNLPVHPVEHLLVHAPLGGNRWVLVQQVHHVGWSKDRNIGADCLDFLLTNPLGA